MHEETTFSIGEFSTMTGLTVKALRFYQEKGLLIPTAIDPDTNYRYYNLEQIPTARTIAQLRQLELSLQEIQEVLEAGNDEKSVRHILENHRDMLERKARKFKTISKAIDELVSQAGAIENRIQKSGYDVMEKPVTEVLVAGIRMRGRYADCGSGFSKLGRSVGRHICGKAMLLIYDDEYREEDADFEVCFPIRKAIKPLSMEGARTQVLPAGTCLSVIHRGPYQQLSQAYERLLRYAKRHGHQLTRPCREIYLKGPGMIFRGNPKNYVTEVQMLF